MSMGTFWVFILMLNTHHNFSLPCLETLSYSSSPFSTVITLLRMPSSHQTETFKKIYSFLHMIKSYRINLRG
jgi:hypothetical protein